MRFSQKDMKTVPSPLPNKNFAEVLECANERIPRRHALATSHWQRYVSNQNTVAKYRPCSSTFSGIIHFAHCQKLLACRGSLKRNSPSGQITKHRTEKDRDRVTETCYRHYASVFLMSGILTLLFFIAPKEKIPSTLSARQAIFVEAKSCSGKYLWLEDALCLRDSGQARSF